MAKNLNEVLDALENSMYALTNFLRDGGPAGEGEVDEGYDDAFIEEPNAGCGDDLDDDSMVTLRSGDLRQVVDAYRTLSRMARTGKVPTQEERFKLHQHIKKVKHLIRKPIR